MASLRTVVGPGRALSGSGLDAAAFDALYRTQAPAVWNYVRYRLGPSEADDLTAEAFTRAWSARASYDPERGSAETWLWAIARHAVTDRLRHRRPIAIGLPEALSVSDAPADVDAQRTLAGVLAALERLAPTDREIVALRFGAGRANRDIAALLELSEANMAQRLRRALRTVRIALQGPEVERPA